MIPNVRLHDLCVAQTGIRNPTAKPDEEFNYVSISSVDNKIKQITQPEKLKGIHAPTRARKIILEKDVIVATTRPNLNAVAIVPRSLDNQICSTGFCVLRCGPKLVPEYLYAFVQSERFVAKLVQLVKGAHYPAVSDAQVLDSDIPLPSLEDQLLIAARLTEQLVLVARARETALTQIAAIEAIPGALLREAFGGDD